MQKVTIDNKEFKTINYANNFEEFLTSIINTFKINENLNDKMIIELDDRTLIENSDDFNNCILGQYPPIFVSFKKNEPKKIQNKIQNSSSVNDMSDFYNKFEKLFEEKIFDKNKQNFNKLNETNTNLINKLNVIINSVNNISNASLNNNLQNSQNLSQFNDNNINNEILMVKLNDTNKKIEELKKSLVIKDEIIKTFNSDIIDKLNNLGSKIENNNNNNSISNDNNIINDFKKINEELKSKKQELETKNSELEKEKQNLLSEINNLKNENYNQKLNFDKVKRAFEEKLKNEYEEELSKKTEEITNLVNILVIFQEKKNIIPKCQLVGDYPIELKVKKSELEDQKEFKKIKIIYNNIGEAIWNQKYSIDLINNYEGNINITTLNEIEKNINKGETYEVNISLTIVEPMEKNYILEFVLKSDKNFVVENSKAIFNLILEDDEVISPNPIPKEPNPKPNKLLSPEKIKKLYDDLNNELNIQNRIDFDLFKVKVEEIINKENYKDMEKENMEDLKDKIADQIL